jgi:hypothetical protein
MNRSHRLGREANKDSPQPTTAAPTAWQGNLALVLPHNLSGWVHRTIRGIRRENSIRRLVRAAMSRTQPIAEGEHRCLTYNRQRPT